MKLQDAQRKKKKEGLDFISQEVLMGFAGDSFTDKMNSASPKHIKLTSNLPNAPYKDLNFPVRSGHTVVQGEAGWEVE